MTKDELIQKLQESDAPGDAVIYTDVRDNVVALNILIDIGDGRLYIEP